MQAGQEGKKKLGGVNSFFFSTKERGNGEKITGSWPGRDESVLEGPDLSAGKLLRPTLWLREKRIGGKGLK